MATSTYMTLGNNCMHDNPSGYYTLRTIDHHVIHDRSLIGMVKEKGQKQVILKDFFGNQTNLGMDVLADKVRKQEVCSA